MRSLSRSLSHLLLPLHAALAPRLPRKNFARFTCHAVLAILLLALVLVLHVLHRRHANQRPPHQAQWRPIAPRNRPHSLPHIPRNIYYLNSEPVMYCYIPKNACSRFKPLLRKREGFVDWADSRKIHGKNGLQRLKWLSRNLAVDRLSDPHIYKFVVVRDPFSRLVSAYQNKVATPWPDQRADFWNKHLRAECPSLIHSSTMPAEGPLMSLETFLHCLLSTDNTEPSNEHWRPQTELCGLDHIRYDNYLHLESLASDAETLLEQLHWRENVTAFRMQRSPVYSRNLSDYFSPRALQLALEYYQQDFQVLPYPRVPTGTIDFYSVFDGTNFQPGFVPPVDFQPPQLNNLSHPNEPSLPPPPLS